MMYGCGIARKLLGVDFIEITIANVTKCFEYRYPVSISNGKFYLNNQLAGFIPLDKNAEMQRKKRQKAVYRQHIAVD